MIRVYGRTTSTNTQKVLWALVESKLDFKLINTSGALGESGRLDGSDPYGFPSNYEAMNPSKTIPAIQFEDKTLCESNTIIRFLAFNHAPHLYGNDLHTFFQCSSWLDWYSNAFPSNSAMGALCTHLVRLPPEKANMELARKMNEKVVLQFQFLDDWLQTRKFMMGEEFTIADIPIGVELCRWLAFSGIDKPDLPNLLHYFDRLKARPAFALQVYENERKHQKRPSIPYMANANIMETISISEPYSEPDAEELSMLMNSDVMAFQMLLNTSWWRQLWVPST